MKSLQQILHERVMRADQHTPNKKVLSIPNALEAVREWLQEQKSKYDPQDKHWSGITLINELLEELDVG